jgi:phosphoribosyl-ATP pyrophosphohydrolase
MNDILSRVADVIDSRHPDKGGNPELSYVARLFSKGDDAALKKVGEEATELVMAAKDARIQNTDIARHKLVCEAADVWFHSLVVLAQHGLRPEAVLAELARREGLSGLAEKAARTTN